MNALPRIPMMSIADELAQVDELNRISSRFTAARVLAEPKDKEAADDAETMAVNAWWNAREALRARIVDVLGISADQLRRIV